MRKIVIDESGEGLDSLLGEPVTVFCMNYIYAGTLVGLNDTCIKLSNAKIVYETGVLTAPDYKDAQALPSDWYVQIAAIESFGRGK